MNISDAFSKDKTSSTTANESIVYRNNTAWACLFIYFGVYLMVAQWDLPTSVRPWFLTGGFCFGVITAISLLFFQIRREYILTIFTSVIILYWLFAYPAAINGNDDNTAYLIFATDFYYDIIKTIQPLSERRLFSVGGNYAFQAPVIHWIGINGLSLVEPVLGLVLFFIVITAQKSAYYSNKCCFLVGALALLPLGGAKVLANTASVFVLSAFTFALLEAGRTILKKQEVTLSEIVLLMVLPLSASILRPTTAPFNFTIAGILLFISVVRLNLGKKAIVFGIFTLIIYYLALYPYHQVGATYLYPILGRGVHITADGYSIAETVSLDKHLTNLFKQCYTDPLLILNIILPIVLIRIDLRNKSFVLVLTSVYLAYYLLMVISTGGLASTRYAFPVSLALVASYLITFISKVNTYFSTHSSSIGLFTRAGWIVGVLSCLVLARVIVGPGVIEKRLRMFEPADAIKPDIDKVQRIANRRNGSIGATLLVLTGYERFLVTKLEGKYFIMDQPGMLEPWRHKGLSYAEGLNEFLVENNVKTIIMTKPNCEKIQNELYSGWKGLIQKGYERNESAMCSLISTFGAESIGPFTILAIK